MLLWKGVISGKRKEGAPISFRISELLYILREIIDLSLGYMDLVLPLGSISSTTSGSSK